MRNWLLICLLLAYGPVFAGPAVAYQVDIAKSAAWFVVGYWGGSVKGKLSLLQGKVELDEGGKTGRGEIVFDMNSVQTGSDFKNDFIKSRRVFETASFPTMRFRPAKFELLNERLLASEGELQLHGVSQMIRLEAKRFVCGETQAAILQENGNLKEGLGDAALANLVFGNNVCYGEFATTVLRSQFGMNSFSMMVDDEVSISVNLVLQKIVP